MGSENSDLKSEVKTILGVDDSRQEDIGELVEHAVGQRVNSAVDMRNWLSDQIRAMVRLGIPSSGSRLKDLLIFLKTVDERIERQQRPSSQF